jgi:outer membrane murein-binding lipoprotein Lpp
MRRRIISIVVVVLLMGLILPGCSTSQINELEAQISELEAQISEQEAQIAEVEEELAEKEAQISKLENQLAGQPDLEAKIAELEKEKAELQAEIDKLKQLPSAKIEITFSANPVPCENGYWDWRTIYTEVNGIGVTFENINSYEYRDNDLLYTFIHEKDFISEKLPGAYLPAYGSVDWGGHISCSENATHFVSTMSGIDDNGNKITATGRVDVER